VRVSELLLVGQQRLHSLNQKNTDHRRLEWYSYSCVHLPILGNPTGRIFLRDYVCRAGLKSTSVKGERIRHSVHNYLDIEGDSSEERWRHLYLNIDQRASWGIMTYISRPVWERFGTAYILTDIERDSSEERRRHLYLNIDQRAS